MLSLHVHSNYSLLQGTIILDDLIAAAKKSGSTYVSLTDTNGMYGLIQFAQKALEERIKPVLGVLINDPTDENLEAVFLAKNNAGYSDLCKIITSRKLKDDFQLIDLFKQNLENLFVLTSSIELLKQIEIDSKLKHNLFVELIVTEKRKRKTRELFEYAKKNGLQITASHPAYFLKQNDYLLHKVVTAIRLNSTLANLEPEDTVDEEYYVKTPDEIKKIWKALPEALWNLNHIAQNR